jgi:hypothetical protein
MWTLPGLGDSLGVSMARLRKTKRDSIFEPCALSIHVFIHDWFDMRFHTYDSTISY